ncbi:MAG: cyclic nucleotide-binding domain-containing protein [Anaerolineales bacterium]|nr:cyclic nucleotide-binding domain-containing protein [Anaerolineales bacterium]
MDLLFLPAEQRELINWLSRRDQARFADIYKALSQDPDQVAPVLSELKEAGYIREAFIDGEIYYRVSFGGKVTRAGRGIAEEIWSLVELDDKAFLKQVSLFKNLSDRVVEEIAEKSNERHWGRNEVVLWQGELIDTLFLIKRGMVKISHIVHNQTPKTLAYLKQGEIFGDMGLLIGQSSTATATALTEVDILQIKRQDFFDLLGEHNTIALELARILGHRLADANARLTGSVQEAHLCVLISVDAAAGCTTLGTAIALMLAHKAAGKTVYTEYPAPERLPKLFGYKEGTEIHHHPGGYDVHVPASAPGLPASVQTTLVFDQLVSSYDHIVIGLLGQMTDKFAYILERADQVILLASSDPTSWPQVMNMYATLKESPAAGNRKLFTVVNQVNPEYDISSARSQFDFEIPFLEGLPELLDRDLENLPERLTDTARALADSLEFTAQIGVYIPSTIGVDKEVDTQAYVDKTLDFLGGLFGGATSTRARGVWKSSEVGLVSENIHLVQSYVTQDDLDQHVPDVIEYVENLKKELEQEAMALEVNQKLMLI